MGGRQGKICCVSETIRCRKLILGRDIGWGCRYAMSLFDLALVTMSLKILSGLSLRSCKV